MDQPEEETIPRQIAAEFLLGELIKVSMRQIKNMAVPFSLMRQAEQAAVLERVENDIREILIEAIDVIASNARMTFRAEVEQVLFKDGIKAVLKMARGENAHALADIAGGFVSVVIEDRTALLDIGDAATVDPDQRPLFDASGDSAQDVMAELPKS